jgi:predicted RNase H-like HicB family nuclease
MKGIHLEVNLPVSILKEGKRFIAYTPALDLSTSGKSYKEVRARFNEIVEIFFEEIISKGTVDEVLTNLGWEKVRAKWIPPVVISQESQSVRI